MLSCMLAYMMLVLSIVYFYVANNVVSGNVAVVEYYKQTEVAQFCVGDSFSVDSFLECAIMASASQTKTFYFSAMKNNCVFVLSSPTCDTRLTKVRVWKNTKRQRKLKNCSKKPKKPKSPFIEVKCLEGKHCTGYIGKTTKKLYLIRILDGRTNIFLDLYPACYRFVFPVLVLLGTTLDVRISQGYKEYSQGDIYILIKAAQNYLFKRKFHMDIKQSQGFPTVKFQLEKFVQIKTFDRGAFHSIVIDYRNGAIGLLGDRKVYFLKRGRIIKNKEFHGHTGFFVMGRNARYAYFARRDGTLYIHKVSCCYGFQGSIDSAIQYTRIKDMGVSENGTLLYVCASRLYVKGINKSVSPAGRIVCERIVVRDGHIGVIRNGKILLYSANDYQFRDKWSMPSLYARKTGRWLLR